jgi:Golgi nucleoside diphosphatase
MNTENLITTFTPSFSTLARAITFFKKHFDSKRIANSFCILNIASRISFSFEHDTKTFFYRRLHILHCHRIFAMNEKEPRGELENRTSYFF